MGYVYDRLQEIENNPKIKSKRLKAKKEIIESVLQSEVDFEAQTGHVYFIKMGDFVKIGYSGGLLSRIKNLEVGFPEPSELLATIPGTKNTEAYFHKIFSSLRVKGEWFKFEGALKAFVSIAAISTLPEISTVKKLSIAEIEAAKEGPWRKPKRNSGRI
ncbi:hypothetical protein RHSP_32219 [Rhizobium freirei PRF 81]|uniref:Bacteriophage T5 Orf172 DNA-binding domain-containing protein n=1 Tax=Rhizobium freirei PRF 81 TaxID=363754 RepID=N6UZG4_9HYPH|nr:GIY-YIG nuclease family protein [Rhizobium freirei]ENN86096.1 hypothetical protein RHSP_32219 [Rhizobium freirei PRF 81]